MEISYSKQASNTSGNSSETNKNPESEKEEQKIEYVSVSAQELSEALSKNALKAQNDYKDKYLEVTGALGTIDSSGDYINIDAGEWDFTIIQCYIQNDDQKNEIMEMSKGDEIAVKGYCKDVGELMGYSIDIDSIKKK